MEADEPRTIFCGHPFVGQAAFTPSGADQSTAWRINSTRLEVVVSDAIDLTATGTHTVDLPNQRAGGLLFFPLSARVVVSAADAVTSPASVSLGVSGDNTALLGVTELTKSAAGGVDHFATLAGYDAVQGAFTAEVTTAAVATTLHAYVALAGYYQQPGELG